MTVTDHDEARDYIGYWNRNHSVKCRFTVKQVADSIASFHAKLQATFHESEHAEGLPDVD